MSIRAEKQSQSNAFTGYRAFRLLVAFLAAFVCVVFGLLSLFVVPAPNDRTAIEISGVLVSISRPHPKYGDIGIVLDNGQRYYINRANEIADFDWEKLLAEVQPGDEVYLTAVTPLAWRLAGSRSGSGPVAGVRTDDTVYMDSAIAANMWTAQKQYSKITIVAMAVLIACILPELNRLLRQRLRPPMHKAA